MSLLVASIIGDCLRALQRQEQRGACTDYCSAIICIVEVCNDMASYMRLHNEIAELTDEIILKNYTHK